MGLAGLVAVVAAQAAVVTPLTPTGKWAVAYEPTECILSRPFGSGDASVTLGLLRYPTSPGGTLILVEPGGKGEGRHGSGKITLQPSGGRFDIDWTSAPRGGLAGSAVRIDSNVEFWKALPIATGLTIERDGVGAIRLILGTMTSALYAYGKCNDELLRRWGADPAAMIAPGPWLTEWVRYDDYPSGAIKRRAEGRTLVLFAIDRSGRSSSCKVVKSSGDLDLDTASCRLGRKGARVPQTADASAQTRWLLLPMSWHLP